MKPMDSCSAILMAAYPLNLVTFVSRFFRRLHWAVPQRLQDLASDKYAFFGYKDGSGSPCNGE
jgi:hypothetical protein